MMKKTKRISERYYKCDKTFCGSSRIAQRVLRISAKPNVCGVGLASESLNYTST
jgi:hypothetical protein